MRTVRRGTVLDPGGDDQRGKQEGQGVESKRTVRVECRHEGGAGHEAEDLARLVGHVPDRRAEDELVSRQHVGQHGRPRRRERRAEQHGAREQDAQHGERGPRYRHPGDQGRPDHVAADHDVPAREQVGQAGQQRAADDRRQVGQGVRQRGEKCGSGPLEDQDRDRDLGKLITDVRQYLGEPERPELADGEHFVVRRLPVPRVPAPSAVRLAGRSGGRAAGRPGGRADARPDLTGLLPPGSFLGWLRACRVLGRRRPGRRTGSRRARRRGGLDGLAAGWDARFGYAVLARASRWPADGRLLRLRRPSPARRAFVPAPGAPCCFVRVSPGLLFLRHLAP